MEGKGLLLIEFTNALAIRRRPCPMFALGHANPQSSKASLTHLHYYLYCTVPYLLSCRQTGRGNCPPHTSPGTEGKDET